MSKSQDEGHEGILVTARATTGWFDWIHGELWLYPNGLLRLPLGLPATLLHNVGLSAPSEQKQPVFHARDNEVDIASQKGLWVPCAAMQKAYLHHGLITDRLRLLVENQPSVKFLWPPQEEAWQLLRTAFTQWLGNQLILD
jgi:hypothetical protein